MVACAGTAANYQVEERQKESVAWLAQQRDIVVCRRSNSDLGYVDTLLSKIPMRQASSGQPPGCADLLGNETEDVREVSYEGSAEGWDSHQLLGATQWMHLHPDRKGCALVVQLTPKRINGSIMSPFDKKILIRDCDGRLASIMDTDIPPGTPACGQAEIPACGTESP